MVTIRIKGGLGNQLFQYAVGYALSQRLGQPLTFDVAFTSNMTARSYRLPFLNVESSEQINEATLPKIFKLLKNPYANKIVRTLKIHNVRLHNWLYWLETEKDFFPDFFLLQGENIYIDGYFQSPKYFEKYRESLLRQITPNYPPEQGYIEVLSSIKDDMSVAVHVRRSDFKKDGNPFHYLLGVDYYKKAIEYMREQVKNPIFYWFSDDMQWVKENFGQAPDFKYISIKTSNGDIDDMMLMSKCRHIIAANSTFSWWAAWLNQSETAIRVVPAKQYGNSAMIPDAWVKL